jgi:hypothetical protein
MGRRASRVRGDGWCGEVLADSNLDSVLRMFPMDNYQKDEAVGGQSGTDFSELDCSNVRSSITRVKEMFGSCSSGCLLGTVVCQGIVSSLGLGLTR